MLQTKVVETIETHILCSVTFFLKSCRLWDNVEECGRAGQVTGGNTIWLMRLTCWITKATDTHSEYVILIAFQRQEWLRERSSLLCCTYVVCFFFHFICPLLTTYFLRFVLFTPSLRFTVILTFLYSYVFAFFFCVMQNHACWDNFYAVSSSLILVWPLWARIPESLPTKVLNCFVLCIVCV